MQPKINIFLFGGTMCAKKSYFTTADEQANSYRIKINSQNKFFFLPAKMRT
jgi:hypothetical protein